MNLLKDKSVLISAIVIAVAGYWLLNNQNDKVSSPNQNEYVQNTESKKDVATLKLSNDIEVVAKKINSVLSKNELWNTLASYEIKAENFVSRSNAREVKEYSELLVMELFQCLDDNYCGMEKDSEDDPYFDPTGTTAHKLIERSLKFLNQALLVDANLKKDLDYDLLQKISEIPSEKIQSLVSQNLEGSQDEVKKVQSSLMRNSSGKARVDALLSLKKSSPDQRMIFLEALKTTFSEGDAYTVVSVAENLDKFKLNDDELAGTIIYLCRFKNESFEHNWSAIKVNVEKIYPDFNKLCNY